MKKFYFTILITITVLTLFGQQKAKNVSIKWGPEFIINNRGYFEEVISGDENSLNVLYGHPGNLITINTLKNNLNISKNKPIQLEFKGKKHNYSNIVDLNGTIYIFTSYRNNSTKINSLYVHEYVKSTNSLKSSKEIFSFDYSGFRKKDSGSIWVKKTENNSNVWVMYELPSKSISEQKFGCIVFDNELNEIWKNEFDVPFEDGDFNIYQTLLNNNEELILIGRKTNERNRKRDPLVIDYLLFILDKNGKVDQTPIKLKNQSIVDLTVRQLPNNDLVVAGFYSNRNSLHSIKGSFYKLYNSKINDFSIEETKDFDFKFMTEGLGSKETKKANKNKEKGGDTEMLNYRFRDLILKNDGGAILVAEQYFIRIIQHYNPNTKTYTNTYYYYYNDIITVSFDKNGSIEWSTKIPKRQMTVNDFGFNSSYALIVNKDKLHFVFYESIDNIINKSNNPVNAFGKRKNTVLCLTTIDSKGKYEKELLIHQKELQFFFSPRLTQQISDNELLIAVNKKKKYKFGILKFEN